MTHTNPTARTVKPLSDPRPGPRCAGCRERIEGTPARDESKRPFHPVCLMEARKGR